METIGLAGHPVRIVRQGVDILWVAADVADALGSAQTGAELVRGLPDETRCMQNVHTSAGLREVVCVNLAGLTMLAGRTRTEQARAVHAQLLAGFTGMVAKAEQLATAVVPAAAPVALLRAPGDMWPWAADEAELRGRVLSLLQDYDASAATRDLLPLSVHRIAGVLQANDHQVFGLCTRMAQEGQVFLDANQNGTVRVGLHATQVSGVENPDDLAMLATALLRVQSMSTAKLAKKLKRKQASVQACLVALESTGAIAQGPDGWVVLASAPTQRRGRA